MFDKILYMMIGAPGSGKDTFIRNFYPNCFVYSTDRYIEEEAEKLGLTYKEHFSDDSFKRAQDSANFWITEAAHAGRSIVWNQTNISARTRVMKMKAFIAACPNAASYMKVAVYLPVSLEELLKRNDHRAEIGRDIPKAVVKRMFHQIDPPTYDEGFSYILTVDPRP